MTTEADRDEAILGCLSVLASLLVMPFTVTLRGWVLSYLWLWFVAETFGMRPLGIAECIGLSVIASSLSSQRINCKQDDRPTYVKMTDAIVSAILSPFIALGFGYIVKSFI